MSNDFYIFAGGGTGGHLYPGLAVAAELHRISPDAQIVFACSDRPVDERILAPTPYAMAPQPIRPFPKNPIEAPGFLWALIRSAAQARQMIRDLRPRAVLGLGGFAAAPIVRMAARSGVRSGLLNPDAVPGRANRYLARFAGAVFTQFEATAETFDPKLIGGVRCVGCPIRRELLDTDRQEAIERFDLPPDRKTLLIFGGSLAARSINDAVAGVVDDLAAAGEDRWSVLHVAGSGSQLYFAEAYAGKIHARVLEYCDRMDLAYAAADLAICRGGASTIAELTATGTPAIIFPYPHHRDQQQRRNAAPLVEAEAATCISDADDVSANVASLRTALLPLLREPGRLESMSASALSLAKPDAAEKVARWLVGE